MNETKVEVDVIRELVEAVAYNIAVWHRGGKGTKAGNRQKRAIREVYQAMTGKYPTEEELDAMGGGSVFGGM